MKTLSKIFLTFAVRHSICTAKSSSFFETTIIGVVSLFSFCSANGECRNLERATPLVIIFLPMRHSVNNNCSQVNCSNLCATPFGSEMSCTERHALQKAFEKLIEPTGMESFISETREALFLITYYILINQTGNEE